VGAFTIRRLMPNPKTTTTTVTTQTVEQYVISDEDWTAIEAYLKMNEADKASVRSFIADVEEDNVNDEN